MNQLKRFEVFHYLWFLFVCFGLVGKQLDLKIRAKSAILMNADTGAILFEKNAHAPIYPASTMKIATTLFVLDQEVELDKLAIVSEEALKVRPSVGWENAPSYWLDKEGTRMWLKSGEMLTINTLLHGVMLVSGNDAANVLAENIAGSVPEFMSQMNLYLKNLGCQNTQFSNPHGLTHPEHWTTAYDLSLMTKHALGIQKFREILSIKVFERPKTNKQPAGKIERINPFIEPKSRYYYPKAIGAKTGYTKASQYNLVAIAEDQDQKRVLIAVVIGSEKIERFREAKRLFETAFSERKALRRLLGPETLFKKKIPGTKLLIKASLIRPLTIKFFPSEEPKCKAVLHWNLERLPIRKGQKIGELHILAEKGKFLKKADLIAREDVRGTLFFTFQQFLKDLFR